MSRIHPNILYVHCHDAGRYVQPYGYAIQTPNIQLLAEQGVLFRQAYCAAPTCSPSRASLLTGQWAHTNGMLGLAHRGFVLHDYRHHIVHVLREIGYESALAGLQHIAHKPFADPQEIGYDEILTQEGSFDGATTAAERFLEGPHDRPFFLSVGYMAPHRQGAESNSRPARCLTCGYALPFLQGQEFRSLFQPADERYVRPPDPLPDMPEIRRDMALYHASMRSTDFCIGRILEALRRGRMQENTIVICTTDHGIAFPGMKCTLTDHGIGVMLMVRGPGGFEGGKVVDALVSQIDLFPTICETVGATIPEWVQGQSLMPLIRGEKQEINEAIFAEVNYHAAYEPQRCIRTKRWKYIRRFGGRTKVILSNVDNSPSKTFCYDCGWADQPVEQEMLFDLKLDPHEQCNVITRPDLRPVVTEMRGRLDEWMHRTDDPLLQGPIPLPSGGELTDPDDYSPSGGWPDELKRADEPRSSPSRTPSARC